MGNAIKNIQYRNVGYLGICHSYSLGKCISRGKVIKLLYMLGTTSRMRKHLEVMPFTWRLVEGRHRRDMVCPSFMLQGH